MKNGSGDDPFAEVEPEPEPETREDETEDPQDSDGEASQSVPWIFTRDGVTSDRSMVPFRLRERTLDREKELVETVEDDLQTTIPKTDVREAAYLVAMQNPEAVSEELREWGFELKE